VEKGVPSACGLVARLKLATLKKSTCYEMLHKAADLNRSFQMAGYAACIDMSRNECRDMGEPEKKGTIWKA